MSQVISIADVFAAHQEEQDRNDYLRELSTDPTTKLQRSDALYAALRLACHVALCSPGALTILKHGSHPTELSKEFRTAMEMTYISWSCADAIYFDARQEHLRARGDFDEVGRSIPSMIHVRSPTPISEVLHKAFKEELEERLQGLEKDGRFKRTSYAGELKTHGLWRLGYPRILAEADFGLMVDTSKVSLKQLIYGTIDGYSSRRFPGFKLAPRLFCGAVRMDQAIYVLQHYLHVEYRGLRPNMRAVVETLVHIVLKMSLTRLEDSATRSNLVLLANRLAVGGEEMDIVMKKLLAPRLQLGREERFPLVEQLSVLAYAMPDEMESSMQSCMDLLRFKSEEVSLQDKLLDGVRSLGPNPKRVDSYSVDGAREVKQFVPRADNKLPMRAAGK